MSKHYLKIKLIKHVGFKIIKSNNSIKPQTINQTFINQLNLMHFGKSEHEMLAIVKEGKGHKVVRFQGHTNLK